MCFFKLKSAFVGEWTLHNCNIVSLHVLTKDFSLHLVDLLSAFCHPEQMSCKTVLRSFASYEPWSRNDIIRAGRGRKRIWPCRHPYLCYQIAVLLFSWVMCFGRTCSAFPVDTEAVSAVFHVIQFHAIFKLREICVCRNRLCSDIWQPIAHDGVLAGKLLAFSLNFWVCPFSSHIVHALEKLNMASACTSCSC